MMYKLLLCLVLGYLIGSLNFAIIYSKLKKDDIILTDRSVTTYVYIGIDKYFMLSGMNYLEAKVG